MVLPLSSRSQPLALKAWARAIAQPATEFPLTPLTVLTGSLPLGLQGSLYRNGPARLQRQGVQVGHWFDGDGAMLAIHFHGAAATGVYRYIQSAGYVEEEAADRYLYHGYGSLAPGNLWQRFQSQLKNVANTSVLALPDRLLALWEGGWPYQLDTYTLETLGTDNLGDLGSPETFSAHPKQHPRTGDIFNFGLVAGANATLNLYRCDANGRVQRRQSIPLNGIPLIHDFILADRYLVFCVSPVRLNALPAVLGLRSFSDALIWQPRQGTQIIVIDADSLEVVACNQVDPWFQWHFGKGCLTIDGHILLEGVMYPDFSINQHLKEIPTGSFQTLAPSQFWRLIVSPQTAEILHREVILDRHCEFPVVQPGIDREGMPTYLSIHRSDGDTAGELFGAIARFDPQKDTLTVADTGADCYPSEPIFAADTLDPAQGWILTVVYDGHRHCSEVWIYDSDRLGAPPVCRLGLPGVVPHSFHGTWQPAR